MKNLISTSILALLLATGSTILAQDYPNEYLGLPGDNLNLYAVMNLFQESETLEGFERDLNDPDSRINNLDLNADNYVDYITVSDYQEGNVHNIVLRVALDRKNYQDVAVFIVEELRNGSVQMQLIGDEALYGKDYIIEPNYAETRNPGYMGPKVQTNQVNVVSTNYYEVAAWPVIRFIYRPGYTVWRSSWHWGYYPSYWVSWRPYYWDYYYGYHSNWYPHYYSWYRPSNHYRWRGYHNHYYSHVRVYSPTVVVNINKGNYRSTYSRPDQRRAGEALYTSVRSGSDTRSRNNTVYKSLDRQSASSRRVSEGGTSVGRTGTDRPTGTAASSNTRPTRTTGQTTATERRPSSAVNNNSSTRPASVQSSSNTRNSSAQSKPQRSNNSRSSAVSVQQPSSGGTSSVQKTSSAPARREADRSSQTISKSPTSRNSSTRSSASSVDNSRSSSSKATVQQPAPSRSSERSASKVSSSGNSRNSSKAVSQERSSSQKSSKSGDAGSSRSRRR